MSDLMKAIFYEVVAFEVEKLCKERYQGGEVDHPCQRRLDCLMLLLEGEWLLIASPGLHC